MIRDWVEPTTEENPRTQLKRRLQQKRCLVCGSRQIRGTSYFCVTHIVTHRFCSDCETLRVRAPKETQDRRCKACQAARCLADYHRNPEVTLYRIRLRQMRERSMTRSDQIFAGLRKRIALADFVAHTPGWSWPRRARLVGHSATGMAAQYREQCRGECRDMDAADRSEKKRQPKVRR